jgi:ABC-type bacteriocin/lantibiotic exporter with double-glycine peptidase domain
MSFLIPVASLVSSGQQLQIAGAHLNRLADVIDASPEQQAKDADIAPSLSGSIELHDVDFQYDPKSPVVLRNVSARIEPGQKAAIVGRTGCGKSTLAMLMLGLFRPTNGEILYDGIPLSEMNYRSVRSQFGVILQQTSLFSGSIRQNISFNDPSLTLEEIMAAASQAAIHDEIMQMPMGYETLISEGGSGLSGGQRQRISIARALARRPSILLLDEATSSLDVTTENAIEQNLNSLSCTRIVIAHRLSTVRNADVILVLNEGTIVERGNHDDLVAINGVYASLVRNQTDTRDVHSIPSLYLSGG